MTKTGKAGHQFLIVASSLETALLALFATGDYVLGRLFHANQVYVWKYWSHFLGDVLMALFGLFTSYVIFMRIQWANRIAVLFFSVAIIFVSAGVFSTGYPDWWLELSLCILPAIALIYLASLRPRVDLMKVSHSS